MLCLQGMFFAASHQNQTLANYAVDPVIREYDRMVYLALSEFFFDSGMFSYYVAGIFQMDIVKEKVSTYIDIQNHSLPRCEYTQFRCHFDVVYYSYVQRLILLNTKL